MKGSAQGYCATAAKVVIGSESKARSMRYVSTRGEVPALDFVEVMLAGLARDGGLYVPEHWPVLNRGAVESFAGKPYAEVAVEVVRPSSEMELPRRISRAWPALCGNFRHPAVAPLTQLGPNLFVLELFHGPTLAFKDLAMQFVARLMDHVLHQRGERTTIVVATSGDTGAAAIEAFRGRGQADLVVLFPQGRISDVQRRMMTTISDANVHAIAIEGTFDDCQALVKSMFNHHVFRDRLRLSGVNSINWARIVAQAVYYFTAAVALGAPHRKVAFTVPTGNLATYTRAMSLRAWACRLIDWWWRQTSMTSSSAPSPAVPTRFAVSLPRPRHRWISRFHRTSNACCSMSVAGTPKRSAD